MSHCIHMSFSWKVVSSIIGGIYRRVYDKFDFIQIDLSSQTHLPDRIGGTFLKGNTDGLKMSAKMFSFANETPQK